jgi:hypothetical protein
MFSNQINCFLLRYFHSLSFWKIYSHHRHHLNKILCIPPSKAKLNAFLEPLSSCFAKEVLFDFLFKSTLGAGLGKAI